MKRTSLINGITLFSLAGATGIFSAMAYLQEDLFLGAMAVLTAVAFVLNELCLKSDNKK